jgi:hypothetical protein
MRMSWTGFCAAIALTGILTAAQSPAAVQGTTALLLYKNEPQLRNYAGSHFVRISSAPADVPRRGGYGTEQKSDCRGTENKNRVGDRARMDRRDSWSSSPERRNRISD